MPAELQTMLDTAANDDDRIAGLLMELGTKYGQLQAISELSKIAAASGQFEDYRQVAVAAFIAVGIDPTTVDGWRFNSRIIH